MKISSMNYLVKQGAKNVWTNRMMSFASYCIILVSLIMVGISILIFLNLDRIISGIEGKSEVVIQLDDNIEKSAISELEKAISAVDNVDTVIFYSKEEAWESMVEDMTNDEKELFQYADDDNPLPDTFKITIKDINRMSDTTNQISTFGGVTDVKSPTSFANVLIGIQRIISLISVAIVAALVIVCLIIISNTTRSSVYARKKEINIMKYVGATNAFIRIPFFIEGMIVGLLSAVSALLLTKFAYEAVYNILSDDFQLWTTLGVKTLYSFSDLFSIVALSYIIAGAVIGAVGTSLSISKHLAV